MQAGALDTIFTAGWRENAEAATTLEVRPESVRRMAAPDHLPSPRGPEYMAPPPGEDPEEPVIGKWAAVVLQGQETEAAQALAPLINHRRQQGYLWGDGIIVIAPSVSGTVESWWRRFERAVGVDPPQYLLLVGGPDRLPFEFQYELDLHRATGRLDVSDTPGGDFSWAACQRYAEKVAAYEQAQISLEAKPLFYSLTSDSSTKVSHDYLVLELAKTIPGTVTALYGDEATAENLAEALAAARAPKLVFTASHGVEFPADPVRWGALTDAAFRGRSDDAVVSAQLASKAERFGHGSIVFAFACFSAGVPERSTVSFLAGESDAPLGMGARVSALPRQLLGHPQGPVAFIGHVDRVSAVAFQSSFGMAGITPYRHFTGWLRQKGATVGRALGTMREDARRVGAQIAAALEQAAQTGGDKTTIREAGRKWIGFHDYRGFILLGDPAVTPP
jgi:hypothetical protein